MTEQGNGAADRPDGAGRDAIVGKLVAGLRLGAEERRLLGAFVTRQEVAAAIAGHLERDGRFPLDVSGQGGRQLVVVENGVKLARHRLAGWRLQVFPTAATAIERYIELEFGPSCGGVPVRPGHQGSRSAIASPDLPPPGGAPAT